VSCLALGATSVHGCWFGVRAAVDERAGAAPGRRADGPRWRRADNWHTTTLVGLTSVASPCLNWTAYWDSRIELLHCLDLDLSLFSFNDLIVSWKSWLGNNVNYPPIESIFRVFTCIFFLPLYSWELGVWLDAPDNYLLCIVDEGVMSFSNAYWASAYADCRMVSACANMLSLNAKQDIWVKGSNHLPQRLDVPVTISL
jgi:hypothetical protein